MQQRRDCTQSHCRGCPLENVQDGSRGRRLGTDIWYTDFQTHAPSVPAIDVLVVNEFPNQQEASYGGIVDSKGGMELRAALKAAGLGESVAYTNLVRCRPMELNGKTRLPTEEEKSACANHVWEDIRLLSPKVVVLLGELATRTMTTYDRWHSHAIHEIAGETKFQRGAVFFPMPNPYLWAYDKNVYPHRKRLTRLCQLLAEVVRGEETPFSRVGTHYYCGTIADVKIAISRVRALDVSKEPKQFGVGLDSETRNLNRVAENAVSCIQFAPSIDMGFVIPIDHFDAPWTPEEREIVVGLLRDLFTDPNLKFDCWVAHEATFDFDKICTRLGITTFSKPIVDPIFMEYLDDENLRATSADDADGIGADSFRSSFNLKALMLARANFRGYDPELLKIRSQDEGFWKCPMNPSKHEGEAKVLAQKFLDYCGMDAYNALRLLILQRRSMDTRGYTRAYDLALKWGWRFTVIRRALEKNGIAIDMEMLNFLTGEHSPISARLDTIPDEIFESSECQEANSKLLTTDPRTSGMQVLFGKKQRIFDNRKGDHLRALFVDVCKLSPVEDEQKLRKTNKPPAMDRHFFAKHDYHPLVQLQSEFTGLFKLKTSYATSMKKYMTDGDYVDNLCDKRLHCSFSNTKTFTGRLASASPSIHQIPRADNFAKQCIKSLFGESLGYCMIESDYGQAEVRWWAQLAGDVDMADMFWRMREVEEAYYRNPTKENKARKKLECDIHLQVAALMFNLPIGEVTKDQRQAAKAIVFGCIYGQTAAALGIKLGVTEAEAAALQVKFISRFKQAGPWLTWIEEEAKRLGYVEAPNGRRRHLGELFAIDDAGTRRQARNSPIQSIASDCTLEAAYAQQLWIESKGYDRSGDVRLLNLVHDAISQGVRLDVDLIREVLKAVEYHMVDYVGPQLEADYGIKLIVPMVADHKLGLRLGHADDWDRGEDVGALVTKLQEQDAALRQGTPYWHFAVQQERVKAAADAAKTTEKLATEVDFKKRQRLQGELNRQRKHIQYLASVAA